MKTTTPTLIKPTWSDPPEKPPMSSPTPSPTPSPITALATPVTAQSELVPPRQKIDLSPPLLAMVIIAAAAFLLIAYSHFLSQHLFPPLRRILQQYRRWRCRLRHHHHFPPFPSSDTDSVPLPLPLPFYDSDAGGGFYVYSPYYGLHDSVINTIPLTTYKSSKLDLFEDCAVCLLDFEDGDYMRTLPHCSHSFHVDCIDVWLRAHATCPICRANDFFPRNSPMIPLMSARIRPSFDSVFLAPLPEQLSSEIQPAATEFLVSPSPTRRGILIQSGDHRRDVDLLLKRSYSFSFERRSFASERLSATTPRRRQRHQSFWLKRPSSWRVFPSPSIFRRRSKFPMSESSVSWRYGGGRMLGYTSSRTRMGDPEALISPDRWRN